MKHFPYSAESVLSNAIPENIYETPDFHPLELPLGLRLRDSEEQLEYLLLASALLLYRSSGGSDRAKFFWGFYEASSPVTQVAVLLTDVIPTVDQTISQTLQTIRELRRKSQATHSPLSQNGVRWEEQHMFFAAHHPTGQPAPNVSESSITLRNIANEMSYRIS